MLQKTTEYDHYGSSRDIIDRTAMVYQSINFTSQKEICLKTEFLRSAVELIKHGSHGYGSPCQNGRSHEAAAKECGGNRAIYTHVVHIKSVTNALNGKGKKQLNIWWCNVYGFDTLLRF